MGICHPSYLAEPCFKISSRFHLHQAHTKQPPRFAQTSKPQNPSRKICTSEKSLFRFKILAYTRSGSKLPRNVVEDGKNNVCRLGQKITGSAKFPILRQHEHRQCILMSPCQVFSVNCLEIIYPLRCWGPRFVPNSDQQRRNIAFFAFVNDQHTVISDICP